MVELEIPVRPAPSNDEWWIRAKTIEDDSWIRKKLDRKRRLPEHMSYLQHYAPEIFNGQPGTVIDIGPGAGETLEIARALGHKHLGIDAPNGIGGMGDKYLTACELIWERQGLNVERCGLKHFNRDAINRRDLWNSCVLINSRGSLEQAFSDHMDGPPHDQHHDCMQMTWRVDEHLETAFRLFAHMAGTFLRSGGVLVIHANGAQEQGRAYGVLSNEMRDAGLIEQSVDTNDIRVMKWRR